MATFHAKIVPLTVPTHVQVQVGEQFVDLSVSELTEAQIAELVEEFANRLLDAAGKS